MTFEIGDAAKVKPGQVLIQRWDETRQQDVDVVISLVAFEHRIPELLLSVPAHMREIGQRRSKGPGRGAVTAAG